MRQGRKPIGLDPRNGAPGLGLPRQAFFVLTDTPCPYVPGQREKKLITEISRDNPTESYSALSRAGFRRSHHFAYRPACTDCRACLPVRIPVQGFTPSRSQKRVRRANAALEASEVLAQATGEQYRVFTKYIASRHGDGEMASMTMADYKGMIHHSRVDTRMVEFRAADGSLAAVCLIDWLDDGPSAVYSFFDPELSRQSPGTFMILWMVEEARRRGLPYAYLGYLVEQSPKMAYKMRFRPLEAFGAQGWQTVETSA